MLKYALRGDGCSLGLLAAPLLHSSLGRAKLGLELLQPASLGQIPPHPEHASRVGVFVGLHCSRERRVARRIGLSNIDRKSVV